MSQAFIFPGQGAQFPGMGKTLYDSSNKAKQLFHEANDILNFNIANEMFNGTDESLRQTNVTQPAIFIHSVAAFKTLVNVKADMVAGHSLGEFSALVANETLDFADALTLVSTRANAMQKACELNPSTMAAVLGLEDLVVEEICSEVSRDTGEIVVAANYNCPGQLVISGSLIGIEMACLKLKAAGAKRALILPVGGAFHSPLMLPAKEELAQIINSILFKEPCCPVYQNVLAKAITDPEKIKQNLIEQLTGAVKWTQCVQTMIADGADHFTECGPGKVLQGLVVKINKDMYTDGVN